MNINLIDHSFSPDPSTVRGYSPKLLTYNKQFNPEYPTFITNGEIVRYTQTCVNEGGPLADPHKMYGLLYESKAIIPDVHKFCLSNLLLLHKVFKHIFTFNPKLLEMAPDLFKFAPAYGHWMGTEAGGGPIVDLSKSKGLSAINSGKVFCRGHQARNDFLERHRSLVDGYGAFYDKPGASSLDALAPYRFSICIENDITDNYFTEKILNCFAVKTIPIYIGAPNIGDYFDSRGILPLSILENPQELTDGLYNSLQEAVEANYQLVQKYGCCIEDWVFEKYQL